MEDYIGTEKVVHGRRWGGFHGGYFSDPTIARPLVETARGILAKSPSDMIVDVGGGTGFLLSQFASQDICAGAALVNIDCSEAQLEQTDKESILRVCTSIMDFRRGDIAVDNKRIFFVMRSVLHYLGETGLSSLLCHLREQAKEGEIFVHQSASFDNDQEAACLNALYRHMHTRKWYPTINALEKYLADSGWCITARIQAPPLLLTSDDLGQRYNLDVSDIQHIRDMMAGEFGEANRVFQLTPSGFHANLHYWIYTCVAVRQQL